MSLRFSRSTAVCVAALGVFSVRPAGATVLLSDGFDYGVGSLAGQAGGNWDATRAWSRSGSTSGSLNSINVVPGLTLSDYAVSGNAAEVLTNSGDGNYDNTNAARQLPSTLSIAAGSTVYVSFLFQHNQESSFANGSQLSFGDQAGGANRLISRPVTAFGDDGPDNAAVGPANEVGPGTAAAIAVGTTYLVISKFTNVNGPDFGSGNSGSMWVLDAAKYDAIKADGITESELDANNVVKAFKNEPSDFTVTLTGDQYLRLQASTAFGINNRSQFDEVKLFTSLGDLTAVPEPSALALCGVAAAGLRRRRRA